uniref:Ethylene-insensitive protein 2 n=2 Tax=Anthurium amnicola TaxID=1678845 RepID=A0A1D1ZLX5_9ARAE
MSTGSTSTLQMSGMLPQLFPSLGPALMVSMGYVDLGKWVAAVEGGACFGFNLVLLVIFLNCCAIFCQYLATSIGVATGKNLAQIYSKEYSRSVCIMLGLQAEVSAIALDISTILGIAHGLSVISGLDILMCILFAAVGSVVLPFFITHLDNYKAEILYIGISGFALLFYVLGVLISQPEIPLAMNGILPRLSGENAYSLMALLGANIMVHNFYTHSSIVQQQRRPPNVAVGALSHDHFFAILFVFSGIFLVNYVLMNSAASVFDNAGLVVLTFQDVFLLLDQVFRTPIPPVAFLLVLLFSSLVTALSWNIGGVVVLRDLLNLDLSALVHQVLMRVLAAILALYYAQSTGAEGIYQLLVFCQVVSGMLLPSSVIPLFRVASSKSLMGAFKISWYLEILALVAFFGILASNVIFITELLFGNSSWMVNLRGSAGGGLSLQFIVIFLIAFMSLVLMLYLAVTPLKSASYGPDIQIGTWNSQLDQQQPAEGGMEIDLDKSGCDEDASVIEPVEPVFENSSDSQSDHTVPVSSLDLSDTTTDSGHGSDQPTHSVNLITIPASESNPEDSKTYGQPSSPEIARKVPAVSISDTDNILGIESKGYIGKLSQVEMNRNNEDTEGDVYEPESSKHVISPTLSLGTGPSKNSRVKVEDLCSSTGNISKASGLGRATRRQFAAILDAFWGLLFDFHGKVTQEAITKRVDVLLGLDLKTSSSSTKGETVGSESFKKYLPEVAKQLASATNSSDYNPSRQQRVPSTGSSFVAQMGSTSWSSDMQLLNPPGQNSWQNLAEAGERRYSSLHLPQNSNNWGYQPATVHGYQIPSYLRGFGANRYSDSASIPLEERTLKSAESFTPNYKDPFTSTLEQSRLASLASSDLQNLALTRAKMQVERAYCDSSLLGNSDILSSAYTKKYHSLPDISGLAISGRTAALNERNAQWEGPRTSRAPIGRMSRGHTQYSRHVFGAEGGPLAFDELSPSRLYGDVFSLQSNFIPDTKSLWSRQPFEQFFGVESKTQEDNAANKMNSAPEETFSYADSESKILNSLRLCILKLLKLEGSDWLFRLDGGVDEELINQLAAKERFLSELGAVEVNQLHLNEPFHSHSNEKITSALSYEDDRLPNCGESCIWRMSLIVSFGVWCILRILELSLVESRPELWGKYTYVLNRLQGIIEPAFSKPRSPSFPCPCLSIPAAHRKTPVSPPNNGLQLPAGRARRGTCTSPITVLEIIRDVEAAISGRKGRTGTAAGDIAFPKGKENLASVLKRYKRRLSNKSPGNEVGLLSRKVPLPPTSAF